MYTVAPGPRSRPRSRRQTTQKRPRVPRTAIYRKLDYRALNGLPAPIHTLYRTKIVPSINTSIYRAAHLTKIKTKITRHIKPRLHLDLTKITTKITRHISPRLHLDLTKIKTKITRYISPRLIPRSRGIIESRLRPRLRGTSHQD